MGKFAKNLERLRTERQMTQEELAKRVGVSQPAIAQYEAGTATPRLYVTLRLASALATTVEALIEGKEE
jgi:transcriptional regulator with XRE-family HTH domain